MIQIMDLKRQNNNGGVVFKKLLRNTMHTTLQCNSLKKAQLMLPSFRFVIQLIKKRLK